MTVGNSLGYQARSAMTFRLALNEPLGRTRASGNWADKIYVVQTNPKIVERCMLMTTDPGDLVLDPTCGSGTTAYVAEQWGRRWITIDTSRVALALRVSGSWARKFPYYLLADSAEGRKKESELTGKRCRRPRSTNDIRTGSSTSGCSTSRSSRSPTTRTSWKG